MASYKTGTSGRTERTSERALVTVVVEEKDANAVFASNIRHESDEMYLSLFVCG